MDELWARLLGDVVHAAHAEDIERIHAARAVEALVHLHDHLLLPERVREVRIDLPVERRARIGRQTDQPRPALFVALRGLDDCDLRTAGGMHYLPDVAQPLLPDLVELTTDEVADVLAAGGLALGAVAEEDGAAGEGDAVPAATGLGQHERTAGDGVDGDRGRRPAGTGDLVNFQPLELRLDVALKLLVQQLLVEPRSLHD